MYNKITLHNNCKEGAGSRAGGRWKSYWFWFSSLEIFVSLTFWSKTGERGVRTGWVPPRETQVYEKWIFFFSSTRHKTQRQINSTKVFFFLFIILLLLQSLFFLSFFFLFNLNYVDSEITKLKESSRVQTCPVPPDTHIATPLPHNHDSYHQVPGLTALQVLAKSYFPVCFSLFVLKIFSFSWEAKEKSWRQGEFTTLRCSGRPLLSD